MSILSSVLYWYCKAACFCFQQQPRAPLLNHLIANAGCSTFQGPTQTVRMAKLQRKQPSYINSHLPCSPDQNLKLMRPSDSSYRVGCRAVHHVLAAAPLTKNEQYPIRHPLHDTSSQSVHSADAYCFISAAEIFAMSIHILCQAKPDCPTSFCSTPGRMP